MVGKTVGRMEAVEEKAVDTEKEVAVAAAAVAVATVAVATKAVEESPGREAVERAEVLVVGSAEETEASEAVVGVPCPEDRVESPAEAALTAAPGTVHSHRTRLRHSSKCCRRQFLPGALATVYHQRNSCPHSQHSRWATLLVGYQYPAV